MTHSLPSLPFDKHALQPVMSAETLDYHYGKHHKAYVDKLNQLIVGTAFENLSLDEIVKKSSGPIFNNAAQVWNHNFFWNCLAPAGTSPSNELRAALEKTFQNMENFQDQFAKAAIAQFGSGWAWLVIDDKKSLSIVTTSNAENPITKGIKPILTIDVWEHAYYIDYRNDRAKFLKEVFKIVNWNFVTSQFKA